MTASDPHLILQVQDLTTGYRRGRRSQALQQGLGFCLRRGELCCLTGPNGVGKTTLLRTLAGLLPPLAGEIRFLGSPLSSWRPRDLARHLSLTLTDPPASGALTARQAVALGRYPYTGFWGKESPQDQALIARALQRTGMEAKAHCPLGELSDGERQRVVLAKALAQEADLILMDEPTAFLDSSRRQATFALLRRLTQEEGLCVLMATHQEELARTCAHRILALNAQGLLNLDPPFDV